MEEVLRTSEAVRYMCCFSFKCMCGKYACVHRDHTAAEVSDEGQNIRPRSAKKRGRREYERTSSQSDSDAEAVQHQEVSEAMADAFAQRAPPEGAATSEDATHQANTFPEVGVSGMEAIEAEAGQRFRQVILCMLLPTTGYRVSSVCLLRKCLGRSKHTILLYSQQKQILQRSLRLTSKASAKRV